MVFTAVRGERSRRTFPYRKEERIPWRALVPGPGAGTGSIRIGSCGPAPTVHHHGGWGAESLQGRQFTTIGIPPCRGISLSPGPDAASDCTAHPCPAPPGERIRLLFPAVRPGGPPGRSAAAGQQRPRRRRQPRRSTASLPPACGPAPLPG